MDEGIFAQVDRRLKEIISAAAKDGGKTYDIMAENIRRESGSGLVLEALGYVPPEAEELSATDPFRPIWKKGKPFRRKPNISFTILAHLPSVDRSIRLAW